MDDWRIVGTLAVIVFGAVSWARAVILGQEKRVNRTLDQKSGHWDKRFDDWTNSFNNKFDSLEKQIANSENRLRDEMKDIKADMRDIKLQLSRE